jgi:hypothetical protein
MGQSLCADTKTKLPDLEDDLRITDTALLEEIERLREKYNDDIERSRMYMNR